MRISILLFILIELGCSNKQTNNIEIALLNDEFVSSDILKRPDPFDTLYQFKSKTIFKFSVKNNSDNIYYFNLSRNSSLLNNIKYISTVNCGLVITNSKLDTVTTGTRFSRKNNREGLFKYEQIWNNKMGYKNHPGQTFSKRTNNFVLHPGEIRFIEGYVTLPVGDSLNTDNVKIDSTDNYYASLFICSDSTDTNGLSKSELNNIQKNKYQIYHGLLYSTNKVLIRIIN